MKSAQFISDERLRAMAHHARALAGSFTDPKTATAEIRVLELLALVDELVARRALGPDAPRPVSR